MIGTYLKMAFRQIGRSKVYSLINIVGLAIGLAACFVVLVYVSYQLSFDRNHEKLERICLVTAESRGFGGAGLRIDRCAGDGQLSGCTGRHSRPGGEPAI